MRIAVATDLTARSDRAIARAFLLARELRGDLRILHVVDAELPAELSEHTRDWAKRQIEEEAERLSERTGVRARIEIATGHPATEVASRCHPGATDLLVIGIHDPAAPRAKGFAETTAGIIIRSSLTAALLVRNEPSEPYRQVVVGVDFSMFSLAAVRQAARFAPAACLRLIHAYHLPFKGFIDSASMADDVAYGQRLQLDAFLKDQMGLLEERARDAGIPSGSVATVLREGEPSQVLREECTRLSADLVVVGTQGRTGLSRALWGSVAADLLNRPPTDLLVTKPF